MPIARSSAAGAVGATFALAGLFVAAFAAADEPGHAVMLLLVAPVLEEIVFRAGLQEGLMRPGSRLTPLAAVLVTALAIMLVHLWAQPGLLALAVFVPAVAIGLVYARWRRLRWCVLLHTAANAVWILFASRATSG